MKKFLRPLSLFFVISLLVTTGQGCFGGAKDPSEIEQITLNYWRVFDGEDTFDQIIDSYRLIHPNVVINYRKLRFDEYEEELIRALAEGNGPDIFSVHNTWMHEYQDLMDPMPSSVTITQLEERGTVRKEVVAVTKEKQTISQTKLSKQFVDAVPEDVILSYQPDPSISAQDRIYGLPLSLDSLALFYNIDLLNSAGIATPPVTWTQFQEQVGKLTTLNSEGNILQSGAALGTSDNVERAADILSLLMLQNGTTMTDERGRIAFNVTIGGATDGTTPGLDAAYFYTDFANPTKVVYSWNEDQPNSFEAFANGEAAFFLGYSYHIPLLRTAAPKLNFSIGKAPQISNSKEVNFANFWVEAVSAQSDYKDWAWDFIEHASSEEQVSSYLSAAQKPTALRNLISTQLDDEKLGPFAEQVLTAESWYKGRDVDAAEEAFKELIDNILHGTLESAHDALELAAQKVAQTF
jgi:ABC-type glycerol-3-phosphate transport system substrate-binding protein